MPKNKKVISTGICLLAIAGIAAAAYAITNTDTPTVQKTILFSDFVSGDRTLSAAEGDSLDSVQASDDLMYLDTRSAVLKNTETGTEYKMVTSSFENGSLAYTFEVDADFTTLDDYDVIPPVVYIEEEPEEEITTSLTGTNELFAMEVSDSIEKFPDAPRGVLVEYTAYDTKTVPFSMVLISDGEVYDNCSTSYYFDNETGDFTRGYFIFFGITVDELSADAALEVNSVAHKYIPTDFSLAE